MTCIGLSGQGKGKSCSLKLERDGPLLSANALSSQRRQPQAIVRAAMFLFTHPFVCLFVSRCSRKEACEKWAEPLHFSTELKQCVDITVTPDNMSVTSVSTQVIEFYMLRQKHKITQVLHRNHSHNVFLSWTPTTASFMSIAFTVQ